MVICFWWPQVHYVFRTFNWNSFSGIPGQAADDGMGQQEPGGGRSRTGHQAGTARGQGGELFCPSLEARSQSDGRAVFSHRWVVLFAVSVGCCVCRLCYWIEGYREKHTSPLYWSWNGNPAVVHSNSVVLKLLGFHKSLSGVFFGHLFSIDLPNQLLFFCP